MNSIGSNSAKILPRLSTSLSIRGLPSGKSFDHSIANILERESIEEQTPTSEVIRLKVKKFLATTIFGQIYVNTLLVLSILSCMQYIYSTYLKASTSQGQVRISISFNFSNPPS